MSEKMEPNWKVFCQVCGVKPTVDDTKLCGVCTFGEAERVDWYLYDESGVTNDKEK